MSPKVLQRLTTLLARRSVAVINLADTKSPAIHLSRGQFCKPDIHYVPQSSLLGFSASAGNNRDSRRSSACTVAGVYDGKNHAIHRASPFFPSPSPLTLLSHPPTPQIQQDRLPINHAKDSSQAQSRSEDGGGAGALSELLILERMMYRTKMKAGLETIPSPHECFELIGGSGTGGIIALMLGRLRMSVKEAILAYDSLRPQSKIMNMNAGIPVLFRSYDTPDEPANDCLIWEAARATSVTPGLFKPMTIGLSGIQQQYIDSSIGNNNPTSLVLEEAKQLYPSHPVVLISSIGTGHPDTIQLPQSLSATGLAKVFKMMATDCERTHEDTTRRFRSIPNVYFHFNVQQDTKSKLTEAVKIILRYFNGDVGCRHVCLLYGLGGAGKSQIAFKFVEMSSVPQPRTQQTIENDLVTLALVKGIGKTAEDSLHWLSHQHREWLIVFNNADDIRLNLVKFFPLGSHGNILITSHNPDLGQHAQTKHKVDQMELEDSRDLLLATADYDKTTETIGIATQIVQVLSLWTQTVWLEPISHHPVFSTIFYTTWQMSFDQLSNQAAKLLQLCSFLHHDGITGEIFEQASYEFMADGPIEADLQEASDFLASFLENSTWDSMKFMVLTDELRCYSLIQLEGTSRHSNIHDVMLAAESLWVYVDEGKHRDGEKLANSMLGNGNIKESETLSIQLALARMYEAEGRLDDAKGLEEGVLKQRTELLGQDHSDTLVAMGNLACTHSALGDFWRVKELEMVVLTKYRTIFGDSHPRTLRAMANLADTYSALGDHKRAEEFHTAVVNRHRETVGEDHPDALRAMGNLACTHSNLGKLSQAEELRTTVLNKYRRIFGEDHPDTLRAMANLAVTYWTLGHFSQAEELEMIVLNKRKKIFGDDHPDTLVAMANLAGTYRGLGWFSQAEELEIIVLNKHRDIFGNSHPSTQCTIRNLAWTRSNLGQPGQENDREILETHRSDSFNPGAVEMTESIIDDSEVDDPALLFH
ncbi:hypothetical protein C8R44DRAFT_745985 [Mycena epipterygia]|nr:hypothetical protein C8R44DRAFT_745985 [Mycena epipterygia]